MIQRDVYDQFFASIEWAKQTRETKIWAEVAQHMAAHVMAMVNPTWKFIDLDNPETRHRHPLIGSRPVLICTKKGYVLRARWVAKFTDEGFQELEDGDYNEEDDTYYLKEGWYETNFFEEVNWLVDDEVIAWQELPKPPDIGEPPVPKVILNMGPREAK